MTITMQDCRASGMCRRGVQAFFAQHNMDWDTFRKDGLPEEAFLATGDALALQLVENTRGRNDGR